MRWARPTRSIAGVTAGVCAAFVLASCTADSTSAGSAPGGSDAQAPGGGGSEAEQAAPPPPFEASVLAGADRGVPVDTRVRVAADNGTIDRVQVYRGSRAPARMVDGTLARDGSGWRATELLEPGATYTVLSTGTAQGAGRGTVRDTFTTQALTLDEQTYPSISPLQGETVGVGMPVIITFDIPVTNRAAIEQHLAVQSEPQVTGSWHWLSDTEVHYRPKTYWPAGTEVNVDVGINSIDAGNGIYGQMDREVSFQVGDSVISRVNVATHQMDVEVNGQTRRTIPISAGKPGFETRSGTKLIVEMFESKRMDAATVGIQPGDPEYYNIPEVEYAMRVTYTGEFLHAAPWSVGSQGSENVSHGCVGMSTANAAWLYGISHRGDVVDVTGSGRALEYGNGWTDWDMSWQEYQEGSALS
ncbi:MAG: L,D-transpeptidase family protein [Nocardioidaceae bacterium]|nr:L,D-transpeptidase family protein [Nocardioidaceae bacterium]